MRRWGGWKDECIQVGLTEGKANGRTQKGGGGLPKFNQDKGEGHHLHDSPTSHFQVLPDAQVKGSELSSIGPSDKLLGEVNQASTTSESSKR